MIFHPDIKPPYYAVIFVTQRSEDLSGYEKMALSMSELAAQQVGYLGMDSVSDNQIGMTVSYWRNEDSIKLWKQVIAHKAAQTKGRERWYADYHLHVAKIEREYSKANSEFL